MVTQLRNEITINKFKTTKVKGLESKIISVANTSKRKDNITSVMDKKDSKIKIFYTKLKRP
jgi:hypothetical protein